MRFGRRSAPEQPVPDQFLPLAAPVFHILIALADQDRHGYSIMQDVAARTDDQVRLSPGTLYGAIKRLLADGLVEELMERPDPEHDDERRRYYRLTSFGRAVAEAEVARLQGILKQARAAGLEPRRA